MGVSARPMTFRNSVLNLYLLSAHTSSCFHLASLSAVEWEASQKCFFQSFSLFCLSSKVTFWWIFFLLTLTFSAAFVCEDGWTLSEELCLKVVGTATSFAEASTQCANLATGGLLAAPKSEAILNTINNLNPDGDDVWVGLDDRCILLFVVG